MKVKDRISELNKQISELSEEVKFLQESCPHNEYRIGTYSWRVGSYDQRRICNDCGSILDTPSKEELQEFEDEIYQDIKNNMEEGRRFIKPSYTIGQGTKVYQS